VNRGTVQRWLTATPPALASSFVAVVVEPAGQQDSRSTPDRTDPPSEPLVLTAPNGFCLHGLNLDDAIHALRRLS